MLFYIFKCIQEIHEGISLKRTLQPCTKEYFQESFHHHIVYAKVFSLPKNIQLNHLLNHLLYPEQPKRAVGFFVYIYTYCILIKPIHARDSETRVFRVHVYTSLIFVEKFQLHTLSFFFYIYQPFHTSILMLLFRVPANNSTLHSIFQLHHPTENLKKKIVFRYQ